MPWSSQSAPTPSSHPDIPPIRVRAPDPPTCRSGLPDSDAGVGWNGVDLVNLLSGSFEVAGATGTRCSVAWKCSEVRMVHEVHGGNVQ
jgi:hypothetical protein